MNKTLLAVSFAALSLAGTAQSFTLTQKNFSLAGFSSEQMFEAQVKLTNSSANDSDFTWAKVDENFANGWLYSFCDPVNCYDNNSGIPSTRSFQVRPGKQGVLKFDIYPNSVASSGKLRIAVFRTSVPSLVDTITFNISIWNPSAIKAAQQVDLSVFPNPANEELRLRYDSKNLYHVDLMNLIGNRVKTFNHLQGDERLDIGDLPSGIYILRLYDGNKVISRRFTKN